MKQLEMGGGLTQKNTYQRLIIMKKQSIFLVIKGNAIENITQLHYTVIRTVTIKNIDELISGKRYTQQTELNIFAQLSDLLD